jgi:hypothetical protein
MNSYTLPQANRNSLNWKVYVLAELKRKVENMPSTVDYRALHAIYQT